jgi:hypothetical protein
VSTILSSPNDDTIFATYIIENKGDVKILSSKKVGVDRGERKMSLM